MQVEYAGPDTNGQNSNVWTTQDLTMTNRRSLPDNAEPGIVGPNVRTLDKGHDNDNERSRVLTIETKTEEELRSMHYLAMYKQED